MSGLTRRFQLTTFDSVTDQLRANDYKFSKLDRVLLDRLLALAVEGHHHTGEAAGSTVAAAPTVHASPTGGALRSGATVWYRYGLVDPQGRESPASQPVSINTPAAIPAPTLPATIAVSTGVLQPGTYVYAASAYTTTPNQETALSPAAHSPAVLSTSDTVANAGWIITPPGLPTNATGYNLYRRDPTSFELMFLASVAGSAPYHDDGSVALSRLHRAPTANTTSSTTSVTASTPSPLPLGWSVRWYRTYDPTTWADSLFAWVAQTQAGFDAGTPASVIDQGNATRSGSPVTFGFSVGSPPKVNLTDRAEVQGALPPAMVTVPVQIQYAFPGPVRLGHLPWLWVCEYDRAIVVSVRAALGLGAALSHEHNVRVVFEVMRSGTTSWMPFMPGVEASVRWNDPALPIGTRVDTSSAANRLNQGDALGLRVTYRGVAVEDNDYDLAVGLVLHTQYGSASQTYSWGT